MLDKLGKILARTQTEKPSVYITLGIIITLLLIPGLGFLIGNVEPSLEKVLPQDVEEVVLMNQMRAEYGADMMYLVLETEKVGDLRSYESLKYQELIKSKIIYVDNVLDVTSIASIIKEYNDDVLPTDLELSKRILGMDPRVETLLNDDSSIAVMQIRTDTGSSAKRIKQVIDDINFAIDSLEDYNPGIKSSITGFGAIDKATFNVIIKDFSKITLISFALVAFFVFISFKKLKKTIMALSVVMITLIWTMGITGYLQLTITVVTMVAAAMIMGLGISYGIHVVHRFYELKKNSKSNRKKSISETKKIIEELQGELLTALVGSSMTTSAGFLALLFGVLPAMKNLGIVLGLGIFLTLIITITILPTIIYLAERKNT